MSRQPATFSCPHCRAPLRILHRPADTRHLPCPDCGRSLELSEQAGELLVRPARPPAPAKAVAPRAANPDPPAASRTAVLSTVPRRARNAVSAAAGRLAANPLAVTWLAAGLATTLLGIAFLRSDRTSQVAKAGEVADRASEPSGSVPAAPVRPETPPPPAVADEPLGDVAPGLARAVEPPPEPVDAPKPPASPAVDPRDAIAARLAQPVLRFEQPTPVPFETLRVQIEEIAAVPIRYDASLSGAAMFREAEVGLALTDVTLAAVLDEAARRAGLAVRIDPGGVTLLTLPPDAATSAESASP